jgi:hypothetical protein
VPDFSNVTRYRIQNGYLELGDNPEVIPVASFEVQFQLDQIPSAQITPATGTSFKGRTWATVADALEGETAKLYIVINGITQLLLDGYVSSVSTADDSTMFSRRLGASISIQHRAVKLAGAPSVSFAYAAKGDELQLLTGRKLNVNVFDPKSPKDKSYGIESYVAQYLRQHPSGSDWPGNILKDITKKLFLELNNAQASQDELDGIIKTYAPANLSHLILAPTAFMRNLSEKYSSSWKTQNAWEALRKTAQYLMMHIVPYNSGFYIADPYSLDSVPAVIIKSTEYTSVKKTRTERLSEPINGVVMKKPAGIAYSDISVDQGNYFKDAIIFPPVKDATGSRYYHYRNFPPWLVRERGYTVNVVKKGRPFSDAPTVPDESSRSFYGRIGDLVARSVYAQLLLEQTQIQVVFPYRTDLMPGTVFELENSEDYEISFVGDTMYGMVTGTRIRGTSMTESPGLEVQITAASIRNKEQNESDDYTFDGHPLYNGADGRWVGIDIDGVFVTEPASDLFPSTRPTKTFNSGSGQVNDNG